MISTFEIEIRTARTILQRLKSKIDDIAPSFGDTRNLVYVDYPLHPNIGDLLINLGTESFFETHGFNVIRRYSYHDFPARQIAIGSDVAFAFHGGGNFGDLYPEHLELLLKIVAEYPSHRIVVLPQTVYFSDVAKKRQICESLNRHKALYIYVRDERSLTTLQEEGLVNVILMPDMAHHLAGSLAPQTQSFQGRPLFFIRRDEEQVNHSKLTIPSDALTVDWADGITTSDRFAFAVLIRLVKFAHACGIGTDVHIPWYRVRDRMVRSGIQLISQGEPVHTDRLHAMILGALLEKRVFGYDNSYGKLSNYFRAWLAEHPMISIVSEVGGT